MKTTRKKAVLKRQKLGTGRKLGTPTTATGKSVAVAQQRKATKASPPSRGGARKAIIIDALKRPAGASVADLMKLTGWQSHSVRAALTHLRNDGHTVTKSQDADNDTRYHLLAKSG